MAGGSDPGSKFASSISRPGFGRGRSKAGKRKGSPGRREARTQVYFVRCALTGLTKIGISWTPDRRVMQLQVGSPTPLRFVGAALGTQADEYAIHDRLRDRWSHGEWFRMTDEETDTALERLRAKNGTAAMALAEKVRAAREAATVG